MPATQVDHDDQAAIIYGSGRAGSLFSVAKTDDSGIADVDNASSGEVEVTPPPRPPRVPTPIQETIVLEESFSDALDFMALEEEVAFSPERAKQKSLRTWLLHLHNDILESVKDLNDRRLPLRYPGPSDPVKEARDAMIHAEKLLSSGIIYRLPPGNVEGEGPTNPTEITERYNFMYHVLLRQPQFCKNMLYSSFMLSRAMNLYKRSTPEGKPIHKTEGTLQMIIELAGKVQRAAKRIELEREHQLLVLAGYVVQDASNKGIAVRPKSASAIRCALEQARTVGAMKIDVMFGYLDSYLLRMERLQAASEEVRKSHVMNISKDLQEDIQVHCGMNVHIII